MSWSEGGQCFQIIERHRNQPYRVSVVEHKHSMRRVTLRVTIDGGGMDKPLEAAVRQNVRLVLGLDCDLAEFFDICRNHPTLHVLERIGAGRGLRSASMVENVVKAQCATNVNWTQAVKMINRICQLGPPIRHHVNLNAWPTPREILRAGEDYLKQVCRIGYRSESVLRFCRDVCEGQLDVEPLTELAADPEVETDALLARLRSIHGIGPSSAHYLLSFLGRHERISIDSATIAHVARTHMNGKKPTHRQIERIYEGYGVWKGKVWWFEHWLSWGTARGMLRDAGLT